MESIATVGKDAAIAAPVLMRFLNDPREPMRRKTAMALGRVGPAAQLAIPTLVESLAFDESPAVRDAAETSLAEIGPLRSRPWCIFWRTRNRNSAAGPREVSAR